MTHNDLVAKLRTMLDAATHRVDVTATVLLFGVLFNEEIRDSGSNATRIARDVSGKQYAAMITDGQALARFGFVEPSAEMIRKWKDDRMPADELPGRAFLLDDE